jgi:tripartite-type tricarboxylate transporter receptor subunit TctC
VKGGLEKIVVISVRAQTAAKTNKGAAAGNGTVGRSDMRYVSLPALFMASLALSAPSWGENYPTRPVTIIVPAAPGGPTDTITRILAARMRVTLGETLVIENNGAAGGSIAVGKAARSVPDGYTLSIGHVGTHVFNGAIYPLTYDVLHDFAPISVLATNPQVIDARKEFPAGNLRELLAWLKANPDKALQGTAGAGSPAHITGVYFQHLTGAKFRFVPYRGGAPAMQALLAGEVDLLFDQAANSLPQIKGGRIKAYAVTSKAHLMAAPDIPTVDEAGLPGFYTAIWHGLWAPKGTPSPIINKLNAAVRDALADSAVQHRLADLGQELPPRDQQTPEGLGALQKAEIEKWWPIIKSAGIKAE